MAVRAVGTSYCRQHPICPYHNRTLGHMATFRQARFPSTTPVSLPGWRSFRVCPDLFPTRGPPVPPGVARSTKITRSSNQAYNKRRTGKQNGIPGSIGTGRARFVMFTPIDKPWPFARRAMFVLQIAGIVCLGASVLLEASDLASRLLDLGLRIAAIVFWIPALVFWARWRKTDRTKE